MMQGDPKIDILMRPVRAAIERHVKGRAAVTEIYNRAYEAVMNSMDVNAAELAAANEDAARLASSLENDAYPFPIRRSIDEKDAALRAHRARVGGAS